MNYLKSFNHPFEVADSVEEAPEISVSVEEEVVVVARHFLVVVGSLRLS